MSVTFDIKLDDIGGAIREIVDHIDHALDDSASDVVDIAKGLVPVDTGELKKSIRKEKIENGYYIIVADATQPRAPKGYATYVEFGTARNRAQPFMLPALQAAIPKLIQSLEG